MWQMVQVAKFDKYNTTRFMESGFVVPLAMFVKKRADNFGIFDGIQSQSEKFSISGRGDAKELTQNCINCFRLALLVSNNLFLKCIQ